MLVGGSTTNIMNNAVAHQMSTGALFKGIRSGPKRQKVCYVIKNLYRLHNLKVIKLTLIV